MATKKLGNTAAHGAGNRGTKTAARKSRGSDTASRRKTASDPKPNPVEEEQIRSGYIADFISGTAVRATPEEVQAVQVFARRLVEDFGYPRSCITTRPQYRVRRRPSDIKKSYPVDIAVFKSPKKHDDECQIIVECKAANEKKGRTQLELYLAMSEATVGVWFNGEAHLYLHKNYKEGGLIVFEELPTLPRYGQRVEDIGLYARKDLKVSDRLKAVLRDIRHHLAGNVTGITRDQTFAQQIINILFCKIYDEMAKGPEEFCDFRAGVGEPSETVLERVLDLFAQVKRRYDDVFEDGDLIEIDAENVAYVVGELQPYCITEAKRDVIGDAFEVFMGPALRGEEGQFFTPRNVVHMMVDIIDPNPEDVIIDPACGSGGFLIASLDHVWRTIETRGKKKKWSKERIREEQRHVASQHFRGIEKDSFLAKVAKSYMAILGDGRGGIFCDNSLLPPQRWGPLLRSTVELGKFDVVLTNPPFGTKIPIRGEETLRQYTLGHTAARSKTTGNYEWSKTLHDKQPPQLVFIERCLQLLRPGGRLGIVIPESILGMPTYTHIVQFLRSRVRVIGVVSMPEDLFQPHTHAKTAVLFAKKEEPQPGDEIFMSVVEWCGHDSRGNPTIRVRADGTTEELDDVPKVAAEFHRLVKRV